MLNRKRVINLSIENVQRLYRAGYSSRQIAAQLGWSKSYIARFTKSIARTKSEALRLRCPSRPSKHWRTCRQQARKKMEYNLGRKLTRNEHVHHIDRDFMNNNLVKENNT